MLNLVKRSLNRSRMAPSAVSGRSVSRLACFWFKQRGFAFPHCDFLQLVFANSHYAVLLDINVATQMPLIVVSLESGPNDLHIVFSNKH